MVPLDLTHAVLASREILYRIKGNAAGNLPAPASDIRPLFYELLYFFGANYYDTAGIVEGPPLHDPIAVASLLPADVLHFQDGNGERWHVEIVTDGLHSSEPKEHGPLGRTVVSPVSAGEIGGVRIPRALDTEQFWRLINDALTTAEERVQDQTDI